MAENPLQVLACSDYGHADALDIVLLGKDELMPFDSRQVERAEHSGVVEEEAAKAVDVPRLIIRIPRPPPPAAHGQKRKERCARDVSSDRRRMRSGLPTCIPDLRNPSEHAKLQMGDIPPPLAIVETCKNKKNHT